MTIRTKTERPYSHDIFREYLPLSMNGWMCGRVYYDDFDRVVKVVVYFESVESFVSQAVFNSACGKPPKLFTSIGGSFVDDFNFFEHLDKTVSYGDLHPVPPGWAGKP